MVNVSNSPRPERSTPMEEDWCYAQVKVDNFSYTWTICNFSYYCKNVNKNEISSPTFSAVVYGAAELIWRLKINLNKEDKDFMSLFLILVACDKSEVSVKVEFVILNANEELVNRHMTRGVYKLFRDGSIGCKNFLKRDECHQYADTERFPPDMLIIYCQVSVIEDIIEIVQQSAGAIQVPECPLLNNLGLLFEDQQFCDVTFAVRGKEFQAHKVILAAQSPVFSAMFGHEMKERETNRVDITDMDPEVWREMVRFIYTGKVANLKEMANDLLTAADKYGVERLKKMCEWALVKKLNVENATEIFILADLHDAPQLKAHVMDFVVTFAKDVIDTESFQSMANSYPHLTKEILRALVTSEQTLSKNNKETSFSLFLLP
ncbi:PREDICTED: speckle-type POZ protein-like [Vollenhovia emeryi]|uniref:speckle-type POZ protein-like n=1 Tax=Vollenhovia emeryi TaxID=411798 RepID=UPI0005F4F298|nr:PREDICTED: speckle-type POZ protein-like [Vollenhovia emeryi]